MGSTLRSLETLRPRVILLDVEGTVSPLSFVREVLFPYAAQNVRDYLSRNFRSPEMQISFFAFEAHHAVDQKRGYDPPPLDSSSNSAIVRSMAAYVAWLVARDDKLLVLKQLQGKIWQEGYEAGVLQAPVFEDVAPAFLRWLEAGLRIAIFSSGSSLAQRLFFKHSTAGDLTPHIYDYFDFENAGYKQYSESYHLISESLEETPEDILFVSDSAIELACAAEAGMQALFCFRPGNEPQPAEFHFDLITSLEGIPC